MENRKQPEIRFCGFTDDWEECKANEIFKSLVEKGKEMLPVLSVTQDNGVVYREDVGIDIKYDPKTLNSYKVIYPGDFVISLRSFQGGFELSDKLGITSPAYTIFKPKIVEKYDNLFWKTQFKTFRFIESLKTVTFGIRDGKSISFSEFGDLKLHFPTLEEQQKIGNFFKELDDAIALHQHKLELLKEQKKGFLQKMFPKAGASTPEIRFAGFTDDWEEQKLGELASFSKGNGYTKNDLVESGYPIILYGRLYTKYETVIENVDTFVNKKDKSIISEGYEVIVPASGETSEDISRASAVGVSGLILGGDLNIIKPVNYIDSIFLALTISNGSQQKEMSKRAQGKSVVHLHNSDLKQVNLLYPKLEEQQKISQFFKQLDNTIALHQQELELLKETKKGFLQKMFV